MVTISVVIPLYNKQASIVRAVESIFAQEYQLFEIIVIDDGSTDGSVERLEHVCDPRLRIVRQENAGPGVARNRGAALAQGEYLAFLDADDCWKPAYLSTAHKILSADPGLDGFVAAYDTGSYATLQPNLLLKLIARSGEFALPLSAPPALVKDHVDAAQASCVVLKRSTFVECGGFYNEPHCTYGEDTYLWLQMVLFRRIYYDRTQLVDFHVEDSQLGVGRKGERPTNPALIEADVLRRSIPSDRAILFERLLGFYRLRETQKLARSGRWKEIREWRKRFPWPEFPGWDLLRQERKLELRCLHSLVSGKAAGS